MLEDWPKLILIYGGLSYPDSWFSLVPVKQQSISFRQDHMLPACGQCLPCSFLSSSQTRWHVNPFSETNGAKNDSVLMGSHRTQAAPTCAGQRNECYACRWRNQGMPCAIPDPVLGGQFPPGLTIPRSGERSPQGYAKRPMLTGPIQQLWTSLVVHWLRTCLPMQVARVRPLIREDFTRRGAANSYWVSGSPQPPISHVENGKMVKGYSLPGHKATVSGRYHHSWQQGQLGSADFLSPVLVGHSAVVSFQTSQGARPLGKVDGSAGRGQHGGWGIQGFFWDESHEMWTVS